MRRLFAIVTGIFAAALAGGLALGAEVAVYMLIEALKAGENVALVGLSGVMVGLYAALFFVAGLTFIGLPTLFGLRAVQRSGPLAAALAGGIGATAVVTGMMLLAGVTDSALAFALFLIPPGALAGWLLWRIALRPRHDPADPSR
jgi:hypothetical protein